MPPETIGVRVAAGDVEEFAVHVDPDDLTLLELISDQKPVISSLVSIEDSVAYVDLMDALQLLGVDVVDATRFVCSLKATDPATFMEIYGQGRMVKMANNRQDLNLRGLDAIDLRTNKPDGSPWDLSKQEDQDLAEALVVQTKPRLLIGSPPCTAWCILNQHLTFPKMDPSRVQQIMTQAREHIQFVCRRYRLQLDNTRFILHEQPLTAKNWLEPCVTQLLDLKNVQVVTGHRCQYGLTAPDADGLPAPALKPTRWMSNSRCMLARLDRKCPRDHQHQPLLSGRAHAAERYPDELLLEILRGMRDEEDQAMLREEEEEQDYHRIAAINSTFDDPNLYSPSMSYQFARQTALCAMQSTKTNLTYTDGSTTQHPIGGHFKEAFYDEYTREVLPQELIQQAMSEEMEYFCKHVWQIASFEDAKKDVDATFIGGRWVNCNKGDTQQPKVRARYVATEVNNEDDSTYFAATPPLEALRLLFNQFAMQAPTNPRLKLSQVDIKKAYFHATPSRSLYIKVPKELGLPPNTYGRLLKCCYGTRDAGALWEECYAGVLLGLGFQRGRACPTLFWHHTKKISIVVHGIDFVALGESAELDWYEKAIGENLRSAICVASVVTLRTPKRKGS